MKAPALASAALASAALLAGVHAQQPAAPSPPAAAADTRVHALHVQRNVHMLTGGGANVTVQVGPDGILLVDTHDATFAGAVAPVVRQLSPRPLHTIINTHLHPDHTGGNEALVKLGAGGAQPVRVIAHESVYNKMVEAAIASNRNVPTAALPQSTYFTPSRDFFVNGEAIFIYHVPAAHTDGDSIVHFRGSDVVSTGDVFTPDHYPVIDVANGGSVQGTIAALNKILELTVPARYQEGGTYVIPGHGRLCDEAEVVEYRDMVTIIRDRVQDLVARKRTLEQVKQARPTRDYDTEYGPAGAHWTTDMFVEAVYWSLTNAKS